MLGVGRKLGREGVSVSWVRYTGGLGGGSRGRNGGERIGSRITCRWTLDTDGQDEDGRERDESRWVASSGLQSWWPWPLSRVCRVSSRFGAEATELGSGLLHWKRLADIEGQTSRGEDWELEAWALKG